MCVVLHMANNVGIKCSTGSHLKLQNVNLKSELMINTINTLNNLGFN